MGKAISNEEAKKIELDLLIWFADFCEEHELRYYLAYGTLIGAIRHRGFIPWDNDVDVVMPRPDYERLMVLLKAETVCGHRKLLDYHEVHTFPFLKLVDSRTVLKEHFLTSEEGLGVYIDIFPLDGFPDSMTEQKQLFKKAAFYYKLFAFANYRFNTGRNWKKRMIKNILYPFSRIVSSHEVCEKLNRMCREYSYDTSDYVGNIVWGWDEREILPKQYFHTAYGEFEGHRFCIPSGYDQCLTMGYGDYMKIPPEEEQITHQFAAEWRD